MSLWGPIINPYAVASVVPPSLVQSANNSVATAFSTLGATFGATPTEGNLLVAAIYGQTTGGFGWSGIPSGWSGPTPDLMTGPHGDFGRLQLYWKKAGAAEAKTHTWTKSGPDDAAALLIAEFDNITDTTPFDVAASSEETGNGLVAASGTTASTSAEPAVAVAACLITNDGATVGAWANGFTQIYSESLNPVGTEGDFTWGVAYKILSATGAQSTTLTFSGIGDDERAGCIGVFLQ